jgi:hypothetical protein
MIILSQSLPEGKRTITGTSPVETPLIRFHLKSPYGDTEKEGATALLSFASIKMRSCKDLLNFG